MPCCPVGDIVTGQREILRTLYGRDGKSAVVLEWAPGVESWLLSVWLHVDGQETPSVVFAPAGVPGFAAVVGGIAAVGATSGLDLTGLRPEQAFDLGALTAELLADAEARGFACAVERLRAEGARALERATAAGDESGGWDMYDAAADYLESESSDG